MHLSISTIKSTLPWVLVALTCLLAVTVWGNSFQWDLTAINAYQFFPLLGLLGFSIMWSHYVVGALTTSLLKGVELKPYFQYTGYAVLLAIVLHPSILIYKRFRDGYGLPPHSYETYVAPMLGWITLLGTASLLVFLAFELKRFFGSKPWFTYVADAGDFAMLAILYHGLRLGSQLQGGWYHYVWLLYGVVLVVILLRKYTLRVLDKLTPPHSMPA